MVEAKVGTSIVLAADDPAALAAFYGRLLGVEPQAGLSEQHWRLPWPAGGWLELYAPSRSRPQPRQCGRLALCLQRQAGGREAIAVLEAWASDAIALGAALADAPRQEPFGAEAWLLDPEGNRLLLLPIAPPGLPPPVVRPIVCPTDSEAPQMEESPPEHRRGAR
jgi:hypothetical protein